MSGRTAGCPSCGAPIEFRNAATVLVVCASCGGASTRKGLDFTRLGRVAEVTLTNPAWLERLLARRAASAAPTGPSRTAPLGEGRVGAGASPLRAAWRNHLLPWIRSRSAGWKFQVVARGAE